MPLIARGRGAAILIDPREAIRATSPTSTPAPGRRRRSSPAASTRRSPAATAAACARIASDRGLDRVVLAGGVFQNRLLLERTAASCIADAGLRVLVPAALPPNDGAISFGQVAVAAARRRRALGDGRRASTGSSPSRSTPAPATSPSREMTVDEVEARAAELRGAAGFGPMQRMAAVASVWEGLAAAMRTAGAGTVADLDRDEL